MTTTTEEALRLWLKQWIKLRPAPEDFYPYDSHYRYMENKLKTLFWEVWYEEVDD